MAFSRLLKVNVTVAGETIATGQQSSVSYNGVTFIFDRDMPVGVFATGEPFVVSDQAFKITSISPASSDLQSDGFVGHGAMKNAAAAAAAQGFDGYLGSYPIKTTYETAYSASLNIDPAISGDIALAAGETATITKSVRAAGKTSNTAQFQTIGAYVHLTVLDTPPPSGTVRPGIAGSTKRLRSVNDVAFTPRGFALPQSWPSVGSILASVPEDLGLYSSAGEKRRFFRIDQALGTTNDGYSAEITPFYARYIYALNSIALTDVQRAAALARILTFANDIEAALGAGASLNAGAGQGGGIWLWGMAAAALLQDETLLQTIRTAGLQPDTPFWISAADVGVPAPGKAGVAAQTYFIEQIGVPHVQPDEVGSHHAARYFTIAASLISWEALAILGFDQGPGAMASGAAMILNGGANDSTNQSAAILGLMARRDTWSPNPQTSYPTETAWRDGWSQVLGFGDFTPWTGKPEQPPMGNDSVLNDDYFAAGAGAGDITFDEGGIDFATETVTRTDMRYSLDNVQWVELSDVALTGGQFTISGLLNSAAHWCGWRRHSVSGTGLWSANHPYATPITSGADRGKVTTSGTPASAAPDYTGGTRPQIHARLHPGWAYETWKPVSGTIDVDDVELSAGVGYVAAGYPAPSYTYQWKRDGVNISGATAKNYTRTAADAGTVLTCDVTATNASGSDTVTTAGVTCPAIQNPPAGTLIDTDFRGAFAIDYEGELQSASGTNYTVTHAPTAQPIDQGENYGALFFDKTGGYPSGWFDLSRAAVASTAYDLSGQIVIVGTTDSSRGDFHLEILDGTATVLADVVTIGAEVANADGNNLLLDFATSFTTGADTTLSLRLRWGDGTGGTSAADQYLTRLTISQV